jgi:2'-5' RNA ligase
VSASIPLFLALKPEPRLFDIVQNYKHRTRELAGEQLYLSDPPHLTVFLAVFPAEFRAMDVLATVMTRPAPMIRLIGWHSWLGDPLTGRNTLVCDIHPDDKIQLRQFQMSVVNALAPHRDVAATNARLASRLSALSPDQQECLHRLGFPYLGDGWQPHLSIASIEPAAWPAVWAELKDQPPHGEFTLSSLDEFELHGVEPIHRRGLTFS